MGTTPLTVDSRPTTTSTRGTGRMAAATAQSTYQTILSQHSPSSSSWISLAHDVQNFTVYGFAQFMIDNARKLNYDLVTLGECLADPPSTGIETPSLADLVPPSYRSRSPRRRHLPHPRPLRDRPPSLSPPAITTPPGTVPAKANNNITPTPVPSANFGFNYTTTASANATKPAAISASSSTSKGAAPAGPTSSSIAKRNSVVGFLVVCLRLVSWVVASLTCHAMIR